MSRRVCFFLLFLAVRRGNWRRHSSWMCSMLCAKWCGSPNVPPRVPVAKEHVPHGATIEAERDRVCVVGLSFLSVSFPGLSQTADSPKCSHVPFTTRRRKTRRTDVPFHGRPVAFCLFVSRLLLARSRASSLCCCSLLLLLLLRLQRSSFDCQSSRLLDRLTGSRCKFQSQTFP